MKSRSEKKPTQKAIILSFLRSSGGWVPSWDLEKKNTQWGWIGTSGGRRCRELYEGGTIEREIRGRYVYYRIPKTGIVEELAQLKVVTTAIRQSRLFSWHISILLYTTSMPTLKAQRTDKSSASTRSIIVKVGREEHRRLKMKAAKHGTTISSLLRKSIDTLITP